MKTFKYWIEEMYGDIGHKLLYGKKSGDASLGLHIIKFPSGKYGFAGRVPIELGYKRKDGKPLSNFEIEEISERLKFGGAFVPKYAQRSVFDTEEEAYKFAEEMGYETKTPESGHRSGATAH